MKNANLSSLAVMTLLLFGSSVAFGQAKLRIDDNGKVIAADEHHRDKIRHKITWTRQSDASKSWFVKFADSPCAEGDTFASNGTKTCTVNVCKKKGDSACKAYKYSSATSSAGPLNDPDIIVDP